MKWQKRKDYSEDKNQVKAGTQKVNTEASVCLECICQTLWVETGFHCFGTWEDRK